MTSLAKQLQRLAVPQTHSLRYEDKRRVSLLFDPKEAANQDRESVFALGHSGLEELENIDDAFIEYESTLFSETNQSFERNVQTKDVNDKLDATIGRFLVHMSPYLLLKSSHKTLEWLIYRYHIHLYNVDDLLLCCFPYHDTKIFVRIIQLVKLSDPTSKWNWLEACSRSGVPLARGTLVNHCKRNPGFLTFMCELIPKFIKVHGPESTQLRCVISLYTTSMLASIQHSEDVNERIMSILIPHLVTGMKSKCLDYTAGSYMILSQLCSQVKISEKVIDNLVKVLIKKMKTQLVIEGVMCLAVVMETQKIKQLPYKSFKSLCSVPGFLHVLTNLSNKSKIPNLVRALVCQLVPAAVKYGLEGMTASSTEDSDSGFHNKPAYAVLLKGIIQDISLEPDLPSYIAVTVIHELISKAVSQDVTESWQQVAQTLLRALESRYSMVLDEAIQQSFEECKNDQTAVGYLQELTALTSTPIKYQQVKGEVSLLLGLHHANAITRILAVKQLVSQITSKKEKAEQKGKQLTVCEFEKEALLSRLVDDENRVVQEVLELDQILVLVLPHDQLQPRLLQILQKGHAKNSNWKKISLLTVAKLLCALLSHSADQRLLVQLLPHLLVTLDRAGKSNQALAKAIVTYCIENQVQPVVVFGQDWLNLLETQSGDTSAQDVVIHQLNSLVITSLAELVMHPDNKMADFIPNLMAQSVENNLCGYLTLSVFTLVLQSTRDRDLQVKTAKDIINMINVIVPKSEKKQVASVEISNSQQEQQKIWLETLQHNLKIPVSFIIWVLKIVSKEITKTKVQGTWCYQRNDHHELLKSLLDLLIRKSCVSGAAGEEGERKNHKGSQILWRQMLAHYVNIDLEFSTLIKVCSLVWMNGSDTPSSPLLQVGCCHLLDKKLSSSSETDFEELIGTTKNLFASLLSLLLSPHKTLRESGIMCLKSLRRVLGKDHLHSAVLKKLVKRQEEILIDHLHTPQLIGVFYKKPENKQSLDDLLECICAADTPLTVKERLLQGISCVPHELVLAKLTPVGDGILNELHNLRHHATKVAILAHILKRFDDESAALMTVGDNSAFEFLLRCLNGKVGAFPDKESAAMMDHTSNIVHELYFTTLKQITNEFFHALPSIELQQNLITAILDAMMIDDQFERVSKGTSTLKHLKMNGIHIQKELRLAIDDDGVAQKVKDAKRSKKEAKPLNYGRLTLILEIIHSRKKVKDTVMLVENLFKLLKRLLADCVDDSEYCKQLVLTSLYNQCSRWTVEDKPQNHESLQMELLVQCIRSSARPQTQQQALLVMSAVARLFPEYILHNVMSVFTFMGSNLLQQDDSHSLQVITQTLETLIPAIVKAHGEETTTSSKQLQDLVTQILQVFVDARPHIPKHRCELLFPRILATVGVREYSWVFSVLVVESAVRHRGVPAIRSSPEEETEHITEKGVTLIDKDLDFVCKLCGNQDLVTNLETANRLLEFLHCFTAINLDVKGVTGSSVRRVVNKTGEGESVYPTHSHTLTPQQRRLLQYYTTKVVALILSMDTFVSQVLDQLEKSDSEFTAGFQNFVKKCLSYVTSIAKVYGSQSNAPTAKFWKSLLGKIYEILEKVNYLLPSSVFLQMMAPMVHHEHISVRKKAMELLSNKLQQLEVHRLQPQEIENLLNMVTTLMSIVNSSASEAESEADHLIIKQFALFSVKVLCKMLGAEHPQSFTKIFPDIVALLKNKSVAAPVIGNSLLCIAEFCTSLKAHSIPYLNTFMQPLIHVLQNTDLLKTNELLLTCSLTTVQRVLSNLAHFVSPYLTQILAAICGVSEFVKIAPVGDNEGSKRPLPATRLRAVRHHLAVDIPARVMVPAVTKTYNEILQTQSQESVMCLLQILKEHIETMIKEDLVSHQSLLTEFFCTALDVRNRGSNLSMPARIAVESVTMDSLVAMVVRLSEMSFRPLYYRLYDWASREDTQIYKMRKITFFKLSQRISDRLRSLFNIFVGHCIKMACQVLEQNNTASVKEPYFSLGTDCNEAESKQKSYELVTHVLRMLYSCLLHDTERFVTMSMFNNLLHPLVNQIENFVDYSEGEYSSHLSEQVVPCISQLALASRDDSSWKSLNYQVCLKTRHNSTQVRFGTLLVVDAIAHKLGDEYTTLLPETIPFLAELMEDESEEVEQQCQKVVTSLEKLLGESLQSYF